MDIISHYQYYSKEKWSNINPFNKKAVNDFLIECRAKKLGQTTIEQYESDLRILLCYIFEYCNNLKVTVLNKKDIRGMIIWLSDDLCLSNARVNRILSCTRSFFGYLEDDDDYKCKNIISQKLKNLPQESVREIIFLPNKIIMQLYDYFIENERYRDATLLALLYESGGRKNELSQVKKQCIIDKTYNTNIVIGKRGKKFSLIYFDLTQYAGEKYLEQRGNDNKDSLFLTKKGTQATSSTIYNWVISWRKIVEKLSGKYYKFNVHSFRHSCLQNFMDGTHEVCSNKGINSVGFEELRKIAHHESIVITSSYLKKENDLDQLKKFFNNSDNKSKEEKEDNIDYKMVLNKKDKEYIENLIKQITQEITSQIVNEVMVQLKKELNNLKV